MSPIQLAKVESVNIRDIWPDEAKDFTPWLATADGLELLSNTIGANLELRQTEASVGSFSADLLARVAGEEEHLVVVEAQLNQTDHDHLGKLITYASGLNAKTVVWIAGSFTDEHRQALDWINETSSERVRYFGLEVYVIRIRGSIPAPQFKVVSSPNVWAQEVRTEAQFTATKLDQRKFWEELGEFIRSKGSSLPLRKPLPQHWYDIAIGRSNFNLALSINTRLNRVGCELYMSGPLAKQAFTLLQADKEAIERELDLNLEWQLLEGKEASRIAAYQQGSISNQIQRDELKDWLYATAERFHRVFAPRVKALKLSQESG